MAITLNTQPPTFHPLNSAIYKVSSTRPTIQSFVVSVIDAGTSAVIATQRYATLPMSPLSTTFDLAPLLSSVVDTEVNTSPLQIVALSRLVKSYVVGITEIYLDVDGNKVEGDDTASDQKFVWNGMLSRPDYSVYNLNKYVAYQGNANTQFLSNRPLVSNVYTSSTVWLYFLNGNGGKVRIRFYKRPGVLVGEHVTAFTIDTTAHKINVSPYALQSYFGDTLINMYGQEFNEVFTSEFGTLYTVGDADYYTVQLLTTGNAVASELRTFTMKANDCRREMVELLFSNNLGGIDSMMFTAPKQTVSVDKETIEANPWQIDSDGNYYDNRDGLFNPTNVTISSKVTNSFSIMSEPLSDADALYARSLMESENVFIRLSGGLFLPVQIDSRDYLIGKRRYSTDNNRLTVTFRVNDINFNL